MNSVPQFLQQKLMEMRLKNPRLSSRYFAQKIGVSSGALTEILQGKRRVSAKLAKRIAGRLQLDPSETASFLGEPDPKDAAAPAEYLQLRDDQFHFIAEWPHFAILNLVKSAKCIHRPSWFANQLNLPIKTVHQ